MMEFDTGKKKNNMRLSRDQDGEKKPEDPNNKIPGWSYIKKPASSAK